MLFHKDKHAEMEIYNDINGNLVNLFKCAKYHPNAISEELELVINSREYFLDFISLYNNSALTEIQRASMYFYLIKASYGSKVTHFGANFKDTTNAQYLKKVKERLKSVVIENKSFDKLILQHDAQDSLFYCDPPYYGAESFYAAGGASFDEEQHLKLNSILKEIKGKAIISYNDSDFIRELYRDFSIEETERSNNLALRYGKNKQYKELIIRNY